MRSIQVPTIEHNKIQIVSQIENLMEPPVSSETRIIFPPVALLNSLWHRNYSHRARTFFEPFKKDNQPSQIRTSLIQITKATLYEKERYQSLKLNALSIWLIPVVIFDGTLLEAYIREEEVEVRDSDHVVVEFEQVRRADPFRTEQFLVDVVHRSHLTAFLQEVETSFEALSSTLRGAFTANEAKFAKPGVG